MNIQYKNLVNYNSIAADISQTVKVVSIFDQVSMAIATVYDLL